MSFDQTDRANLGRPLYFDLKAHIAATESLIRSDEIMLAFKLLDMVPAWYREPGNYPPELTEIRQTLCRNLYDTFEYAADPDEAGWSEADASQQFGTAYTYPRAEILLQTVRAYNEQGLRPWVFELSTSHGLLPLGLKREGVDFRFAAKNINQPALVKLKGWLGNLWQEAPEPGQPTVFVFCEALEHAYREEDLRQSYYKLGLDFDVIILSVPLGCLGGGLPNWRDRRLGHVRGYTRKEFFDLADSYFPGREWEMCPEFSMVLKGVRK
jgi:hypothetical protein